MKQKNTHGGTRQGAGRPPIEEPRKSRSIRLTDAEYQQVKIFIFSIRTSS